MKLAFLFPSFLVVALATGARAQDDKPFVFIAPHALAPSPNGFDLYLAAAKAVQQPKPPVDPAWDGDALDLSPAQKQERYSLARRLQWERDSAKAWVLFDEAKRARSLHPLKRSLHAHWPRYNDLSRLGRDKTALANTRVLQGRWNEALGNDLDVVQMSHDIQRGGSSFPMLVGQAIGAIGMSAVWHAFPSGMRDDKGLGITEDVTEHLSAREARQGARRLEELIETAPRLSDILREDKAVTQTQWLELWNTPSPRSNTSAFPLLPTKKADELSQTQKFALYNREATAFLSRADRPIGAIKWWPDLQLNVLAISTYHPRVDAVEYACERALEQQLMLHLALRAFRLEHGQPPSKLSALVPRYLKQVPVDPFGAGGTWKYRNGVAWSIGPDGKDDGGRPLYQANHRLTRPDFVRSFVLGDVVASG